MKFNGLEVEYCDHCEKAMVRCPVCKGNSCGQACTCTPFDKNLEDWYDYYPKFYEEIEKEFAEHQKIARQKKIDEQVKKIEKYKSQIEIRRLDIKYLEEDIVFAQDRIYRLNFKTHEEYLASLDAKNGN